jgi:hypothetical protein
VKHVFLSLGFSLSLSLLPSLSLSLSLSLALALSLDDTRFPVANQFALAFMVASPRRGR